MSVFSKLTGVHVKVPGLRQVGGVVDKGINATGKAVTSTAGKAVLGSILAATGVGAPAAAALMAASQIGGKLATGKNIGQAASAGLKAGATGALVGGAGKFLGGLPGVSKLGGIVKSLPGYDTVSGAVDKVKGIGQGIDQASGGAFTKLGQAARKTVSDSEGGLDAGKIVGLLGAGSALIGQQQQNKAANAYMNRQQGLQDRLLGQADADYQSRAPLRNAGIAKLSGMLSTKRSSDVYRPFLQKEMNATG